MHTPCSLTHVLWASSGGSQEKLIASPYLAKSVQLCWGVNDAMILSICHKKVAVSFFVGENYLTLSQIPAICTICSICILIYNMHYMYLLFTESGKGLDIHLILWWIPSAIQVEPLNEKQGNADELMGRIKHRVQRMCPVVLRTTSLKKN